MRSVSVAASAVLAFASLAAGPGAAAGPSTALLDGLRADLAARAETLDAGGDPRGAVLRAALKNIDKLDSASLAEDVGAFKKVAKKVELAFGVNDADLLEALGPFLDAVTANLASADAAADALLRESLAEGVGALLDEARAALVTARDAGLPVAARAAALKTAQKRIQKALAKVQKGSACNPHRFGALKCELDGADFRPRFGHGSVARFQSSGEIAVLTFQGYFYDRSAPSDPYHEGALEFSIHGPAFSGTGTYVIDGALDAFLSVTVEGSTEVATSGRIVVTAYDAAARTIEGTFEASLEGGATELTAGAFRFCNWEEPTILASR